MLHFQITPQGTLGEEYRPVEPAQKEPGRAVVPGAALAALLQAEEDWDDDAPDDYVDFDRLAHPETPRDRPRAPLTADFAENPDGTLTLLRWPRLARPAIVPNTVQGRAVTAIAATAFAATHLAEELFAGMFTSPVSYSVFSMRMGRHITQEELDEGGPTAVRLPAGLRHIGPYAFWHCTRLAEITLPKGITALPVGVFGECSALARVDLPVGLASIGWMPRPTDQVMPDVGAFAGCHALRALTLPPALGVLGAHTFNSSGLVQLTVLDTGPGPAWGRTVTVATTAFDHTAALLWLDKADVRGAVQYRLGLPAARDKILAGDSRFGAILRIPEQFFCHEPAFFDALAQRAFRLDFSARMALARLAWGAGLAPADRQWYLDLLVKYFDRAPQFMPGAAGEQAYAALFDFLQAQPGLRAADMSALLRTAGLLALPAELLARMVEVRTRQFASVTGFEDLELDD